MPTLPEAFARYPNHPMAGALRTAWDACSPHTVSTEALDNWVTRCLQGKPYSEVLYFPAGVTLLCLLLQPRGTTVKVLIEVLHGSDPYFDISSAKRFASTLDQLISIADLIENGPPPCNASPQTNPSP